MKREAKLVLGGGAAYGLAHIGALEAIAEAFNITGIVGTSMGAIIGGLCALGKTPQEILSIALDSKSELIFNPFKLSRLPLAAATSVRRGLLGRGQLLSLFNNWTERTLIEELPMGFVAVAFDLRKSSTVLIDRGPLAMAMRASSSLPLLFPPHAWGKYLFVDGGVEHPLPLAFADGVPGDFTIAVNVLPPVSAQAERIETGITEKNRRIWPHQVFIRSVLLNQGYVAIQEMLQRPPDLYIDAHDQSKGFFDISGARDFYEYGYKAARERIAEGHETGFMERIVERYRNLLARFGRKAG